MSLSEEEVYLGAKRWLIQNGYSVLAGQPARGNDHLPVIEIKQPTGEKGSRNAYKPDLVAFKDGSFYIIECKPEFNRDDLEKIRSILSSDIRERMFFQELEQYGLLRRINYNEPFETFRDSIEGMLAFSGNAGPACELKQLIVKSWKGTAKLVQSVDFSS